MYDPSQIRFAVYTRPVFSVPKTREMREHRSYRPVLPRRDTFCAPPPVLVHGLLRTGLIAGEIGIGCGYFKAPVHLLGHVTHRTGALDPLPGMGHVTHRTGALDPLPGITPDRAWPASNSFQGTFA
jgi:hypothetical protein